jgi:HlyD family secretion protein
MSKRVWLVLGGIALAVVVLLYLNGLRPAPQVNTVRVERDNLSSSITSNGKVEPVAPYALRARFDGFVDRVLASEGQTVKAGQLLVVLNDADVRAQLDQARAQLESEQEDLRAAKAGGRSDEAAKLAGELKSAEAQRDLLKSQQDSLTKLVAANAATKQELETNRAQLERANAQVEQAQKARQEFGLQAGRDRERLELLVAHSQAEVASLEDKVKSAQVTSPVSGTLYSLPVHARDFLHVGDLVAEVADLTRVRVRAYIDEPELGQLQSDQNVEVTWEALPERTWSGRTESVPRQVVPRGTRNVGEVLCSISNEKMELIPNTTVDVRIQLNARTGVLVVPRAAIQIANPHRYVFRVGGNRLRRQEVRVGLANDTDVEVLSGVQEGDTLALPTGTPLQDNMRVRVENPE